MVTSGSLCGGMVARDVGLSLALGTIFPVFITLTTLVIMTIILYKLHDVWLLNLPCICICKAIASMYVIVSIKRLKFYGDECSSLH